MELLNGATSRMLNEQFCKADRSFNTTYNSDKDVPPFVGIMFEISSFIDIEIITFEVDIRWDMRPEDLSIQVFTIEGSFADRFNQSSAWDKLASTEIIPAPEGNSGVIPASDFTPVSMKALESRSFYITMRGPYLDHTVYGLQKTGDVQIKGDDMQLYVGSGFTSDNFPGAIDKVLDPQFAGIVYYKKAYQCDDNQAKSTTITLQFLLDANGIDDSFVLAYNAALDVAIDKFMATNESMQSFIKDFGLHKSIGATTVKESFNGECPENWKECTPIILRSNLRFSHTNALDTSEVQIVLYNADTATEVIDALRRTLSTERNIANVGIESTSALLQVRIKGLPVGKIIDDVQIRYFEDTTQRFLDRFTGTMAVFSVALKPEQTETRPLRRKLIYGADSNGIVSFNLEVKGAYPIGATITDYIDAINTACVAQPDVFVSLLKNNGIRPSEISEGDRLEYFQGINSLSCDINKSDQAPTQAAPATDGALVRNVIIGIVFSISVCVATLYWIWQIRTRRKKIQEEEKYREERREERRKRRSERSNQEASIRSIDLKPEKDYDSDMESIDQGSTDGFLKKKRFKRSDSTSSISLSLNSLDLDHSPQQSNKSDSPNISSRTENQKKSKLDTISNLLFHSSNQHNKKEKNASQSGLDINKQCHFSQKSNLRSKSLSPNLQTKKSVNSKSLGRSLDLSMIQNDFGDSDSSLQPSHKRTNHPGSLSQFMEKQPTRPSPNSRGCATVQIPVHKFANSTADRSAPSEEASQQSNLPRSKYRPPPISQHRDPSLRRIDIEKTQCQLQQIVGLLPQSSSRSLDGLPLQKKCGPSGIHRSATFGNSKPAMSLSSDKIIRQRSQATNPSRDDERLTNPSRDDERFHRSLDLSDIDAAHDLPSPDREPSGNGKQSANLALHRNLDLIQGDFSNNGGPKRSATQTARSIAQAANPALHRSLDLNSTGISNNTSKVNRALKPKTCQAANSKFHRSLDLTDVAVSISQNNANREPKPNMRQASNFAPNRAVRADERFNRSLDMTKVDASDKHANLNYSQALNDVNAPHKPSNINHGPKRDFKHARSLDLSDAGESHNIMKDNHGTIPNKKQLASPTLHRSFDLSDVGKTIPKQPIRKPNQTERNERLDIKNSLSKSDHGSVRDFCKSVPRTKSGSGAIVPKNQQPPARHSVIEAAKILEVRDRGCKLNNSKKQIINDGIRRHPVPPPA